MKLFVRNIAWEATEDTLRKWLTDAQGYEVSEVRIIQSGEDGRSRGFGFVTFLSDAAGREAMRDLDGEVFMGRELHVEEAVERERGSKKRNGGSRGRRERRGDPVDAPVSWDSPWRGGGGD
jgi:RNA recognition motif-containing protein